MSERRVCNRCGILKPLAAYHANRESADGHHTTCKYCKNARDRERNREKPRRMGGEKVPLIDLAPEGPKLHSCGNALTFGTIDGHGWEWCDHCQTAKRFGR